VIAVVLASTLAAAATGCDELKARADSNKSAAKGEQNAANKSPEQVTPEALRPPAPTGAADDPRTLAAQGSTDAVLRSIRTIRTRLGALREDYKAKAASAKDLKVTAEGMGPLLAAARSDCDLFLRLARDIQHEFRYAASGYTSAARLYRERGRAYRDPELVAVNESLAANFDALARDVPRRARLTDELIERLIETQDFLAETDRCLRDSAAAFAALAAGPEPVTASPASRAFKAQFETFLAVVEDYLGSLLTSLPAKPPAPPPAVEPATPKAVEPTAEPGETRPSPPRPTPSPSGNSSPPPVIVTAATRPVVSAQTVPVQTRYVVAQAVYQPRPVMRTVFVRR
jgi:hypothetical protein